MTRDELYAEAKRLNIAGRSKMTKDQLEIAIAEAKRNDAFAKRCEDATLNTLVRVANKPAQTPVLGVTPAVTDAGFDIEPAPYNEYSVARAAEDSDLWGEWPDDKPIQVVKDEAHQGFQSVPGKSVYPILRPKHKAYAHMPNSERVQKYARQRAGNMQWDVLKGVKLTPKQMRRVRKNANKHGEGFMYAAGTTGIAEREEGYSFLARTPEGLGIFYRFSN